MIKSLPGIVLAGKLGLYLVAAILAGPAAGGPAAVVCLFNFATGFGHDIFSKMFVN